MALIPEVNFTEESYIDESEGGPLTQLSATDPLHYNGTTHVLSVAEASDIQKGVVNLGAQPIAGAKTFATDCPSCAIAPTAAAHLTNKAYVDTAVSMNLSWQYPVQAFHDFSGGSPPGALVGDRYIALTTYALFVASYIYTKSSDAPESWDETVPAEGYCTYNRDTDLAYVYTDAGAWAEIGISIDHGALVGLADDDHAQYALVNGRATDVLRVTNTTQSTSTSTGAIVCSGGIGCAQNLTAGGIIKSTSSALSLSPNNGAIVATGGIGCGEVLSSRGLQVFQLAGGGYQMRMSWNSSRFEFDPTYPGCSYYFRRREDGGQVVIQSDVEATSTGTGSIQTPGGIYCGKRVYATNMTCVNAPSEGTDVVNKTYADSLISTSPSFAELDITGTTDASSTTTGVLRVAGGIGCAKSLYARRAEIDTGALSAGEFCLSCSGTVTAGGGYLRFSDPAKPGKGWRFGTYEAAGHLSLIPEDDAKTQNFYFDSYIPQVRVTATTDATNTSTGALRVLGGIGCAKDVHAENVVAHTSGEILGTADSTSTATGSLKTSGGIGCAKDIHALGINAHAAMRVYDYSAPGTAYVSFRRSGSDFIIDSQGSDIDNLELASSIRSLKLASTQPGAFLCGGGAEIFGDLQVHGAFGMDLIPSGQVGNPTRLRTVGYTGYVSDVATFQYALVGSIVNFGCNAPCTLDASGLTGTGIIVLYTDSPNAPWVIPEIYRPPTPIFRPIYIQYDGNYQLGLLFINQTWNVEFYLNAFTHFANKVITISPFACQWYL